MSRRQLPNVDISVGIGILVILTRTQKFLARDPPGTELYGTSQLCPTSGGSMPEPSCARLLETEPAWTKKEKKIVRYACRHMMAPRTVLDHDGSDGTYSYATLRDAW
jgi:hypothetical protein